MYFLSLLGYRFLSEKKDVQYLFILIYRNDVTQDVPWEDPNSSEKNQLRPEVLNATWLNKTELGHDERS